MPPLIEIKGLAPAITTLRGSMKELRELAGDVQHSASMLAVELKDVGNQIEAARADLRFEAQTLGNSGPASAPSAGASVNGSGAAVEDSAPKPVAAQPAETASLGKTA